MTLHFFNDVFLLHFALEATQGVFERFAFLQSDFCQRNYTPKPSCGTRQLLQDREIKSRVIWNSSGARGPPNAFSEPKPQSELHLPRSVGAGSFHKVCGHLIIRREIIDSNVLSSIIEGRGVAHGTVSG